MEMLGLGLFGWKEVIFGKEWKHLQAGHGSKGYKHRQSAITSSRSRGNQSNLTIHFRSSILSRNIMS